MSYPYQFYAVVVPGLEKLAAHELEVLSAHEIRTDEGGVYFSGTMDTLYRISLRSRLITRILLRLRSFKALSFPELFNKVRRIEWHRFIGDSAGIEISASCRRSRLIHSGRAEQAVRDAVVASVGEHAGNDVQRIYLRIEDDLCTLSIDCSGERLDRRGYRLNPGAAPLRETIAAGLLQWLEWQPDEPLTVPMCGSGTIAIEAALLASRRAPGMDHDFPFRYWPSFHDRRWRKVLERAGSIAGVVPACIEASDIDPKAIEMARQNAEGAEVLEEIDFQVADLFTLALSETGGVMICNPPYGQRIGGASAVELYRQIGDLLRRLPASWRIGVLVPDKQCERAMNLPSLRRLHLRHGGQWLDCLEFRGARLT